MRYVFVTDELPVPGEAGHLALNFAIIDWLRGRGHEVLVLLVGARLTRLAAPHGFAPVAGPDIRQIGRRLLPANGRAAARLTGKALLRALPGAMADRLRRHHHGAEAVLGRFASAAEQKWCAGYIVAQKPDGILIDTMFRAGVLAEPGLENLNSVIVAHDVFHRRHQALTSAGYAVSPAELTQAQEAGWLARARHIAAIQPEEQRILVRMCPAQNVFVAGMPALPCPPPAQNHVLPGRLVFVGSAALPNLDGLRWFFDEIWPRLRDQRVTLDLVGGCGAALRAVPAGVTRLGRTGELAAVLHRAALAIAPLRVGSGLKIKLLDYARHGLHTVATPASLEGFAPDAAAPFSSAADAPAFAAGILAALAARPTPDAALAYVIRHYGTETCFSPLAQALNA